MSVSENIPNGSQDQEENVEFSTLSAELEQLDGALSKLEENSNTFNANALSLLLEMKQIREDSSIQDQQEVTPAGTADGDTGTDSGAK